MRKTNAAWHPLSFIPLAFLLPFLCGVSVRADAPALIHYQGRLADSANNPLTGNHAFLFKIFPAVTGGSAEWTETQTVAVNNGIFEVHLGSNTAFPTTLFDSPNKWLEIAVDGDLLTPRERLLSVPYAARVATASIADGEIKNTAEINPLKINGGTFQNESYTFPGLLKPNGWIGRDATNDKMNIFGAPYDVDSGRIELWGKDAPNNQGNVSLIASDENAGPTSGGKIVFTTYHPSGGLGNDYLVRVIISSAGYVGIGTVNPLERLDLADGSIKIINATTTANAPSPGLISRSGLTFPIASPLGGNVYLNDFGFGFIQESLTSDSAYISGRGGIRFFTNQQQYLTIGGSGNVRVSSTAFQVDGTGGSLKVGGQGTPVTAYLSATQSLDFPSMAKNTTAELTLTVTGAAVGDTVALGPPGTLPADLMAMAYVSAGNTVTVRLANIGGGSIDPAAATYRVSVIRH